MAYIVHCGRCGDEISADDKDIRHVSRSLNKIEISLPKNKIMNTSKFKKPLMTLSKKRPVTVQHFINDMCV